jgi:uncharacterized membrane protein
MTWRNIITLAISVNIGVAYLLIGYLNNSQLIQLVETVI